MGGGHEKHRIQDTTPHQIPFPVKQIGEDVIEIECEVSQEISDAIDKATNDVCKAVEIKEGMWRGEIHEQLADTVLKAQVFAQAEIFYGRAD